MALLVLAIPTFLVTSNVRWAFNEMRLYRYGFERYDVVRSTGLEMDQLMEVAGEIRDYLSSSEPLLSVQVTLFDQERPLFNQREVLHMRDVKELVRKVYRVQEVTGGYILACVVLALLLSRGRAGRALAGYVLWGTLLTVALVLSLGLASLVGFDGLFQQFHALSFSSGTWTFDPTYNYLTRLFTEGFFQQATLFIALAIVVEALLLSVVAWGVRKWVPRLLLRWWAR